MSSPIERLDSNLYCIHFLFHDPHEMGKTFKRIEEGGGGELQYWLDPLAWARLKWSLTFTMSRLEFENLFCQDLKWSVGANGLPHFNYTGNEWRNADGTPRLDIMCKITHETPEGYTRDYNVIPTDPSHPVYFGEGLVKDEDEKESVYEDEDEDEDEDGVEDQDEAEGENRKGTN